jgi:cation diffusion facilitator family transporter
MMSQMTDLRSRLTRLVWLSIGAAIATIALKTLAWRLTGSVGFLSDAAESVVNLVAATVALVTIRWATRPPDDDHMYGHEKAEYFSAGVEGALILVAAASIAFYAIDRLLHPVAIADVGIGIAVSTAATLINLAVATILIRAGREHRSITLEADGKHLMTDVWTSVGVIVGVAAVWATGWERLDPLIALAVAANIVVAGARLIRRSSGGLLDRRLPELEQQEIEAVLERARASGIQFHAVRSRQSGRRSFVSLHMLVPGAWTIQQGHDLSERIEREIREVLPYANVLTHLEPIEDPASFDDETLDRATQVSHSCGLSEKERVGASCVRPKH